MEIRSLFLTLSLGSLLSAAEPVRPAVSPLASAPAEVLQYYNNVNFISCFSTPEERKLVGYMIRTRAVDHLPKRLQTVALTVQSVRKASVSVDEAMVVRPAANDDLCPTEELTEVAATYRDEKVIRVEVHLRSLSKEARSWLVTQYEKVAQHPTADLDTFMRSTLSQTVRKETHTWHQVNGRWVRREAGVVLLKAK
ncbi:hypothetical protein [Prosthecobacter fluviatilis]|uniref:Uncharacterized protein n=1 Tax=Prosthecobacter fluviatilis TaxID=445931 RepID=A0ABW0KTR3_9BACT